MTIHLRDIMTRGDWLKIGILLVVATGCWMWVWTEYQKPMISFEVSDQLEVKAVH